MAKAEYRVYYYKNSITNKAPVQLKIFYRKTMKKTKRNLTNFERHLQEELKDSEFKKIYEYEGRRLQVAHEIAQLRKEEKLSQGEFAKKLRTTQSVISRMEHGNQNFTLGSLERIARVFGKEIRVEFSKHAKV